MGDNQRVFRNERIGNNFPAIFEANRRDNVRLLFGNVRHVSGMGRGLNPDLGGGIRQYDINYLTDLAVRAGMEKAGVNYMTFNGVFFDRVHTPGSNDEGDDAVRHARGFTAYYGTLANTHTHTF